MRVAADSFIKHALGLGQLLPGVDYVGGVGMSPAELRQLEHLYNELGVVQASSADRLRTVSAARRYTASNADPSRLTATQLANAIELAEAVLIAHYRFGADMRNLHSLYPDFTPAPETDELRAIVHEPPETEEERNERLGSKR